MPKQTPNIDEKRRELVRQLTLAEDGDASAQNAVGARLAQGYFVKKDAQSALYWYARAVKQGYTHAKFNLGTMLIAGEGLDSPRIALGMALVEQAAECGDPSACHFLSKSYLHGAYGLKADSEKSKEWNRKAQDCTRFVEYGVPIDVEADGLTIKRPTLESE